VEGGTSVGRSLLTLPDILGFPTMSGEARQWVPRTVTQQFDRIVTYQPSSFAFQTAELVVTGESQWNAICVQQLAEAWVGRVR